MANINSIDNAFFSFLKAARWAFQRAREELSPITRREGPIRLSPSKSIIINEVVTEIEQSTEFEALTMQIFGKYEPRFTGELDYCRQELSTFFRWSGCYIDLFERTSKPDSEYLKLLRDQYEIDEITTRWFALLDGARFSKDLIDFGSFSIRRFTPKDLDNIFDRKVAEIFYPHTIVDSERYSKHWYLVKEVKWKQVTLGHILSQFNPVWHNFREELQAIYMFPVDGNFSLPWFARKSDTLINPFWHLTIFREDNLLPVLPVFDDDGGVIGQAPMTTCSLNEEETTNFNEFVSRCFELFGTYASGKEGEFIRTSLKAFLRAMIKKGAAGAWVEEDAGEEAFVQLVTAIEALVGEKGEGLTDKLARRVAILLGDDESDTIEKWHSMKKFYDMRSDVVHGNREELDKDKLREGLEILPEWVRKATLHMTSLLAEINTDEGRKKIQDLGISSGLKPKKTCLSLVDLGVFSTEARRMVRDAGKALIGG